MKNSLLLITQAQYGSLIDYYQYSLHLKEKYQIEYICWDYNRLKVHTDGVKVHYVSRNGNLFKRNIRFTQAVLAIINSKSYDRVLVNYFRGCLVLPLILARKDGLFLDIRTTGIFASRIKRMFYNTILRFECVFYDKLSVVSDGVKKRLRLRKRTIIIPLGGNYIDVKRTSKSGLHLLYVGTLSNRNIDQTLEGIYLFLQKHKNVNLSYTVIGVGDKQSTLKLQNVIEKYILQDAVHLVGYVPHIELAAYYEQSNIGVSYVPITDYFNYQPVTKTFEYLMSGMPVIATSTYENGLIVKESNGVLIEDNPKSFCEGLIKIYELLQTYDGITIKQELKGYQWKNIALKLEKFLLNN